MIKIGEFLNGGQSYIRVVLLGLILTLLIGCEFILPNKPPFVELTFPEGDELVYTIGEIVPVSVNAYDKDGEIAVVEFYIDDQLSTSLYALPYTFSINTQNITIGEHTVKITAVDNDDKHYIIEFPFSLIGNIVADAGADVIVNTSALSTVLAANILDPGVTGLWTIQSGDGGSFSDATSPNATFTGQSCTEYVLRWTVSQGAHSVFDDVGIKFFHTPTIADAGNDQTFADGRVSTTIYGNTPVEGIGLWSIRDGLGGTIADPTSPSTTFTGTLCTNYTLAWTVETACEASVDVIIVSFGNNEASANAGPDQRYYDGRTVCILAANDPGSATGAWTIVSGANGSFSDPALYNATFTGQVCETYVLRWTITTGCGSSVDDVTIGLGHIPSEADAGNDQTYQDGRTSTFLNGNSPAQGEGLWTIKSGTGGVLDDPTDPRSRFSGMICESYLLTWTVTTPCGSNADDITVTFNNDPTVANAGTDQIITDGAITATLNANQPQHGVGTWTIVSGGVGTFSDINDPYAVFSGQLCGSYTLQWTIATACGQSADQVFISFDLVQVPAFAGVDRRFSDGTTSTVLEANDPSPITGTWTIIHGQGGYFSDVNDPHATFSGAIGELYILEWSINSACGINKDDVSIAFLETGVFQDPRDAKTYQTVTIGTQVWMSQNMDYKTVNYSYAPAGQESLRSIYGLLYEWDAANLACPTGFHLPTDAEWRVLEEKLGMPSDVSLLTGYRGSHEGGTLKQQGLILWHSPNKGATDLVFFDAKPAGYRDKSGNFGLTGSFAAFWTATDNDVNQALYRGMHKDKIELGRDWFNKNSAISVRCIKD